MTIDRIVELLGNEVPRERVQSVLAQQDSVITQFVTLLRKEEDAEQAKERAKDAITITDTVCKP